MKVANIIFVVVTLICGLSVSEANEAECLAKNMYFESRGETIQGNLAVAFVTVNRKNDWRYPDTVCGVVKQAEYKDGLPVLNRCAFSWWCDGEPEKITNWRRYNELLRIAEFFIRDWKHIKDPTGGSTHYHNLKVDPYWRSTLEYTTQIDNHKFYRWD